MVKGFERFFKSFHHALHGLAFVVRGRNFIVQLIIAILVLTTSFYFSLSWVEWLAVIISIFMVLAVEALNTALEEVCNVIKDHPGIPFDATREARDIAAGSALIISIGAAIVGFIIFWPKLLSLFH
jgi:undecaprenol kinase